MFLTVYFFAGKITAIKSSYGFGDNVLCESRGVALNVSSSNDRARCCCHRVLNGKLVTEIVSELWRWLNYECVGDLLDGMEIFSAHSRVRVKLREILKLIWVEVCMLKRRQKWKWRRSECEKNNNRDLLHFHDFVKTQNLNHRWAKLHLVQSYYCWWVENEGLTMRSSCSSSRNPHWIPFLWIFTEFGFSIFFTI